MDAAALALRTVQLNPNNPAYWLSRGFTGKPLDWIGKYQSPILSLFHFFLKKLSPKQQKCPHLLWSIELISLTLITPYIG